MEHVSVKEIIDAFPFLDDRTAQEPFLFNVLLEIKAYQQRVMSGKVGKFASKDDIFESRNIKMPFSPVRDKNLTYILETLTTKYPDHISKIISFSFIFEAESKKLSMKEIEEFTLNLGDDNQRVQDDRDEESLQNFLNLIEQFRIFNMTKLVEKTKYKNDFARVMQKGINKRFFTFKNYYIGKNRLEAYDEYCFHSGNFNKVKNSLNITKFKAITVNYAELIKNRLKKFGILNADFSEYSDNKLDYMLNILIEDIVHSVTPPDLIEIKNFQSLRECLLRVDQNLDPVKVYTQDILQFIRDSKYVTAGDICSNIMNVSSDILRRWTSEQNLSREHILRYVDTGATEYFIEGRSFIPHFKETYKTIRYSPEVFNSYTSNQKEMIKSKMDVLCDAAESAINSGEAKITLLCEDKDIDELRSIIDQYRTYIKELNLRSEISSVKRRPERTSIIGAFISFISSLFTSKKGGEREGSGETAGPALSITRKKKVIKEAKEILHLTRNSIAPVIPLSDFIELNRENDPIIDKIIDEFRDSHMKIVVPVYNARDVLYPKRSSKILIPDIEYLLISPTVLKSPESTTEFIDSIVGYKLKDDTISGKALMVIEKYLRTLYRQRRSLLLKKEFEKS